MYVHRLGNMSWLVVVLMIALMTACAAPVLPVPAVTDAGTESASSTESTPTAEAETAEATIAEASYEGIPVGFTPEGYPYRGNPDAPITVYEFSDYQCPFCARHVIQTEPALKDSYVGEDAVKFVFRDFPLESLHPNAIPAAVAANCVAEQGIVTYWQMHRLLFRTQQEWAQLADPSPVFARLAAEAGATPETYDTCLAETADEKEVAVRESVAEAQSLGFSGTPSFLFVNEASGEEFQLVGAQDYSVFAGYIDTMLAGGAPVDPAAAAQQQPQGEPQIPYWAQAEGLAPDPDNPGLTMAGDFWRGNPDATLVVVEFSDFQCPFCRRHTLDTQPVLDEQFVDPGDVMWVFKHFPVEQSHPQAVVASAAAQCAGDQGQFWEMHDLLFERTEEWANSDVDTALDTLAEELGLDMSQFDLCMDDETTYQAILGDFNDGAAFIRGTPTFVVLYNEQGQLIPGALPADQFSAALTQMLEEANQ